jgi:hypothetical protein
MTSATYRQSAALAPAKAKADPDNRLFGRHSRRRLEAEIIRDSLLAVSGLLDRTQFGPGTLDEGMKRRSLYFFIKRSRLIPSLMVFDAPNALQSIAARPSTTVAPQALMLMNSPHIREYASAFARRLAPTPETSLEAAVLRGYQIALSRSPTPQEKAEALAFLTQQSASYPANGPQSARDLALADFCQVLMSLNEFVYVD